MLAPALGLLISLGVPATIPDLLTGPPCRARPDTRPAGDSPRDDASLTAARAGPEPTPALPEPTGLEPRVQFWELIFARTTSEQFVLHDRSHPQLVYATLDLPRHDGEAGRAYKERADRELEQALAELAAVLRQLVQRRRDLSAAAALADGSSASTPADATSDPGPRQHAWMITAAALFEAQPELLAGADRRLRGQRGMADRFVNALATCRPLRGEIEAALGEHGLPPELYWMVYVETMCTPDARSHAGAAGLWQLMPATARELGLKVDRHRDQRLDPHAATAAAAKMLRSMYAMLGSWPLAVTGYNHGPYGVRRLVQRSGTDDLVQLIASAQSSTFGFASQSFYAELLAAIRVGTRHEAALCGPAAEEMRL